MGYAVHFVISTLSSIPINVAVSMVIQFLCFRICYYTSTKNAFVQSILLTALNGITECVIVFIPYIGITPNDPLSITNTTSLIFTLTSKLLYLTGVMIMSRFFGNNKKNINLAFTGLLLVPILTITIIILMIKVNIVSNLLSLVCFMLLLINIIVLMTNQRMITTETEKNALEMQAFKEKVDYDAYIALKEKYGDLKVMIHDFEKYCNSIEGMLTAEQNEALSMTQKLKNKNKELLLVEYTNNTAFNILLSQKMKECNDEQIDFQLYAKDIDLTFIDEMDVIAIFANIFDNAIESCRRSEVKKVFFSIKLMNENYIVFSIDNSADIEPIVINNSLTSWKQNKNHGIGMHSIKKALSKYGGSLNWNYDKDMKIFNTTILLNILNTPKG